ncbi:hypothetical protein EAI_07037 [Harpegnathos saltator]|uniref:Uncharacterized protein n=1 Tax=Harpegnathos saltator TaxID=610380 RepID=E2BVE2_HARSA|nr:hypothetical protein EAI_07037 [Harpegnathos saltator]
MCKVSVARYNFSEDVESARTIQDLFGIYRDLLEIKNCEDQPDQIEKKGQRKEGRAETEGGGGGGGKEVEEEEEEEEEAITSFVEGACAPTLRTFGSSTSTTAAPERHRGDDDEDAPVSTSVARPWEPPSPTFSQSRSHLLQVHPPHHHQHPAAAHHHQQMNVPTSLIDGVSLQNCTAGPFASGNSGGTSRQRLIELSHGLGALRHYNDLANHPRDEENEIENRRVASRTGAEIAFEERAERRRKSRWRNIEGDEEEDNEDEDNVDDDEEQEQEQEQEVEREEAEEAETRARSPRGEQ